MLLIDTEIDNISCPPNSNRRLLFIKNIMDRKENNWIKTKIRVGSVVKEKLGYMEEKTRDVRIRIISKDVVGCDKDVVGNKKFVFKF